MSKILIVGPSWVGDMVMSQVLYITLKQQNPDVLIDVIAPSWCKPILERMPEVNKAIDLQIGHGELNLAERRRLGKKLKKEKYNQAFVCPNSAKSALIPWFAQIPKRTGWKGEMRYGLLNDLRPNKKAFQYMVERYVALAHPNEEMINSNSLGGLDNLPKPNLTIDRKAQANILKRLELINHRTVIGLCPGAEFGPAKKWPERHYAKIAQNAVENGKQVWIFGSQKDIKTSEKIRSLTNDKEQKHIHVLAGKTSLIEAVDLLSICETVVSNDSGLMHVAAAVGCHVIGIYGSTSPHYTPPLAKKLDIVSIDIECRPCFKRECPLGHLKCLTQLSPDSVLDKLK